MAYKKRGRPFKPTALKVLEGNPGKRDLPAEPQYPVDMCPKPPKFLIPEAKKEWKKLAPALSKIGLLTIADAAAFASYCQAYGRWIQAEEALTKTGLAYLHKDTGSLKRSPYVDVAKSYKNDMLQAATEFGLTPSTRAALVAGTFGQGDGKEAIDPMEAILTAEFDDEDAEGIESNFE